MKIRDNNFLRQHVKLSPKPRPSNNPNKVRLRIFEGPYRFYYGLSKSNQSILVAGFWTCVIPWFMYGAIKRLVGREYKAKAVAQIGGDTDSLREILDKSKKY